ncbi:MAG TPA: response regulator transcription factor [Sulfurovum sp.]|jgi:DNA-binding response OmpR family regulator|nr:MAG: DNA-binding response regulator [Sulfurovum sp. 35-42-20]OYY56859.1 MAG: DNA-binding response regulator [Sulfurovum sp. 28-43-6]OYZ25153.1 MAG: DNA-binding response regulator [Sulfurovum sp. 16-42-52]OYZ50167.1 MAG: DNA-binding response regulator [Sulfurovum sp. 24-42-9]OZA43009.1 MAG: DNA-binding response regulator [Sulfurovum sp. 17-42-90]OZA60076.1 MAG: DNA-binding response regulator [Sulfurovum sp. 39-42-12]HQR73061.1 response regulator transcription factor [Sulfurovum sp.]
MKILLLEDDVILQEIIEEFLVENGYEVESFFDGEKALDAIAVGGYDMLLLDVNVPNIDGFEILKYLRDIGNTTPAIYITSLAGVDDLKKGFELGADDYLKKPFELEELNARIKYIIKRYRLQEEIEFDGMKFIPKAHQIIMQDKVIEMRQKEAQVLEYFIRNAGKIISCDEIIENIWEDDNIPAHATIRTYIKNLRKMFDKEYFENIKGEGYRFNIV